MKVYIEKKPHPYIRAQYLVHWNDPETGIIYGDWFPTMKEIREYFKSCNAEFIKVNF